MNPLHGVTNFARLETTVACAGATKAEAVPAIKQMGFKAIINVRERSEPGAEMDQEEAAAKAAGLNFVNIPFVIAAPAPDLADRFLAEIVKPENTPAFIHCAGGGRAATLWAIKRVKIDGWDEARAFEEATALGHERAVETVRGRVLPDPQALTWILRHSDVTATSWSTGLPTISRTPTDIQCFRG